MDTAGEPVEWCDINEHPEALAEIGTGVEAVRLRLHVREADGHPAVGAAAFAALWRRTPGQRGLGRFLSLPGVSTLAALLYDAFAYLLYAWNRLCRRW
jgi:predicted DCC family thiol-disulfide oxidoreductase YuxK